MKIPKYFAYMLSFHGECFVYLTPGNGLTLDFREAKRFPTPESKGKTYHYMAYLLRQHATPADFEKACSGLEARRVYAINEDHACYWYQAGPDPEDMTEQDSANEDAAHTFTNSTDPFLREMTQDTDVDASGHICPVTGRTFRTGDRVEMMMANPGVRLNHPEVV